MSLTKANAPIRLAGGVHPALSFWLRQGGWDHDGDADGPAALRATSY